MKLLRILTLLLAGCVAQASSATDNASIHRRYLSADRSRYADEVVYYDGLGRPVETVRRGATPSGQSVVSLLEYDGAGRPVRSWRPVVGDGSFMPAGAVSAAAEALYGDSHAFTTTIYQKSPLETVEGTVRPGDVLASSPATVKRYVNGSAREFLAYRFGVDDGGTLVNNGPWPDGMLAAEKSVDEDGRTLIVFTDEHDRTLLERRLADAGVYADTYFVYDGYGDLRYIVPPPAADVLATDRNYGASWDTAFAAVDDYCYYYEKNIFGHVTLFKQPGREAVVYRYDAGNRLTLIQDGNQRQASKWTFSFSDRFGRDAASGEAVLTAAEADAVLADSHVARFTGGGPVCGYEIEGNTAMPDSFFVADIVNYYDSYSFIPEGRKSVFRFDDSGYSDACAGSAMGRLTGSLVSGKLTAVYYDIYGNEVQRHADNHLGFTDHRFCTYSYTDRPLTVRKLTQISASKTVTETLRYSYDAGDRPDAVYHSLDSADAVCLQSNTYNELLQVSSQTVGPTTRSMSYDVQGRLLSVTSPNFSNSLTYERPGCMSGNISVQKWRNSSPLVTEQYSYTYDLLGRLTAADYRGQSEGRYSTAYTYDKAGNPLTLLRKGAVRDLSGTTATGVIDNLVYSYRGHRLSTIVDRAPAIDEEGTLDFDYAGSGEEYGYDANGNLRHDPDRGMEFTYDRNNMPLTVSRCVAGRRPEVTTEYSYDAAGTRQSVTHHTPSTVSSSNPGIITKPTVSTSRRDYVGSCIVSRGRLERILIPGGYILPSGRYFFYLTDYQGNNRAVIDQRGTVGQRTDYYPYGLPIHRTGADVQPYKYGNKEFDPLNGLNTYDFHARAYNPATALWQSPDPHARSYEWLSPYVFCAANPIRYCDPSGKRIELEKKLGLDEIVNILYNLNQLTNDQLRYETQANGMRTIVIDQQKSGKKRAGSKLVREIIGSKQVVTIDYKNQAGHFRKTKNNRNISKAKNIEDATNGKGSGSYISFDEDFNRDKRPAFIGLGHELIHA